MGKFDDQDEMDDFESEEEQEQDAEESEDVEAVADAPAGPSGPAASHEEAPEERTVASRQKQREEMAKEIEEFLSRGGKIAQIEPNVTADPPRKPDSDYGSRPI